MVEEKKNELIPVDIDLIKNLRYEGKYHEASKLLDALVENNKRERRRDRNQVRLNYEKKKKLKHREKEKPIQTPLKRAPWYTHQEENLIDYKMRIASRHERKVIAEKLAKKMGRTPEQITRKYFNMKKLGRNLR